MTKKIYTIATGNFHTSKAAADILDNGGNAYDAILAALFMSFVSEPLLSSLGGGGYLLAKPVNSKAQLFDFFAQTPHNKTLANKDFYPISGDFGMTTQEFHIGMASSAIPGVPAGIFEIHNHYGTMPLQKIAQAAILKAQNGLLVDELHAQVIQILTPVIEVSCHTKSVFSNRKKQLLQQGDIQKNHELAGFMQEFVNSPMDWFYHETPAENIVSDMKHYKGLLSKDDFESYKVILRSPLEFSINDWRILTNSSPAMGGFLITEQLKHALNNPAKNLSHKMIDAMIYADNLKSKQALQVSKGTTHMSVIDAMGNVASLTVSNGEGSGYTVPNGGFMLNNFLGEEDINTGGFFNFKENTRMASMMSPTILESQDNRVALGTGGSNRIKTALFQAIWHFVMEGKTLSQAINHPRFHYENGMLDIEKGHTQENIIELKQHYQQVKEWSNRSLYFGGVNAVQHGKQYLAVGDARRKGVGLIYLKN